MRKNNPFQPQGIRYLVRLAPLFVVAILSGCGGGGGGGGLDIGPGFIIPPDQSPDSSIAPNGSFFLWGMPTTPELAGEITRNPIGFEIESF